MAEILAGEPKPLSDVVHSKLLDELRLYSIVGGLPECVKTRFEGGSLLEVRAIQNDLIVALDGRVQPIEVKSSAAGRLKSLHQLLKESPS